MNKLYFLLLTFFITLTTLQAKDKKLIANNLKLLVTEDDGRFILYGRKDKKDRWMPLIFEDFPSTTFFRFFKGNDRVPFGEGGKGHNSEIKIINNSIIYFWANNELKITLEYQLVQSAEKRPLDTLIIDLTVETVTDDEFDISYFFCLDTYLGESSGRHFVMPGNIITDSETEFSGTTTLSYITSYSERYQTGLSIAFNQEGQVKPARIFFANWKRVEQEGGDYRIKEGRNFDLKPYSINDSALVADYREQEVLFSRNHTNRIILSLAEELELDEEHVEEVVEKESEPVEQSKEPDKIVEEETDTTDEPDDGLNLLNMSLDELLALLDRINKKLESGEKLTKEDVELSEKILEELQKR